MKTKSIFPNKLLALFTGILLLISCSSKKQIVDTTVEKSDADQVEIFMAKGVQLKQVEKEFSAYDLKSKGPSSRSQNIAVFSFDNSKIDGNALLTILMESELVLAAKLMDGKMGGAQSGKSGKKGTVILNQ